jgi:hypothetical protein
LTNALIEAAVQRIKQDVVVEGRRERAIVPGRSRLGKKAEARKTITDETPSASSRVEFELLRRCVARLANRSVNVVCS